MPAEPTPNDHSEPTPNDHPDHVDRSPVQESDLERYRELMIRQREAVVDLIIGFFILADAILTIDRE